MRIAILLCLLVPRLLALDVATLDGKTYTDCRVSRVLPDSICVLWSGGGARIKFVNLPQTVRNEYGFDAEKAAAFERAEASRQEKERVLLEAQRQFYQSQNRSVAAGSTQPAPSRPPGNGVTTGANYAGVRLAVTDNTSFNQISGQSVNQFGGLGRGSAQYVGVQIAGPGGAIYGIGYGPVRQLRP